MRGRERHCWIHIKILFQHLQLKLSLATSSMAEHFTCPPLTRESVQAVHKHIAKNIHQTPVKTCQILNTVASTRQSERRDLGPEQFSSIPSQQSGDHASDSTDPQVRLFLKCENEQRIGAFKARGAFHALGRLIDEQGLENVRKKGVCTHSSGLSYYRHSLSGGSADDTPVHRQSCSSSRIGGENL